MPIIAEAIRDLFRACNPPSIIGPVATMWTMGSVGGRDDATERFGLEAHIEFLLGLALSVTPGSAEADDLQITSAQRHVVKYFRHARSEMIGRPPDGADEGPLGESIFLLRLDRLLDRTEGFAVHLKRIFDSIFEPARQRFEEVLGFCPSDMLAIVRSHFTLSNAYVIKSMQELKDSNRLMSGDPQIATTTRAAISQILLSGQYMRPREAALHGRVDPDAAERMFRELALPWNCQPDFRSSDQVNLARSRPLVRVGERYFCPLSWSLAHETLRWTQELVQSNPSLARTLERRRSAGTENLVSSSLTRIAGSENVHRKQHYDSEEGHGEIDAIALLGDVVLLAEAKSHKLTELGRAGHLGRVRRVLKEAFEEGLDQLARGNRYVLGGGRTFASAEGGPRAELLPARIGRVLRLLVTLERMDPIAFRIIHIARGLEHEDSEVWVISLADLLMLVDLLPTSGEFCGFALFRQQLLQQPAISHLMESDLLGEFLIDGGTRLLNAPPRDVGSRVMVRYQSGAINKYFTAMEGNVAQPRPRTHVAEPVLAALAGSKTHSGWSKIVEAAFHQTPKKWEAFDQKLRAWERTRPRPFLWKFPEPALAVSITDPERGTLSMRADPDAFLSCEYSPIGDDSSTSTPDQPADK
jgi:hypothetical protein